MENTIINKDDKIMLSVVTEIKSVLKNARQNVAVQVNKELIATYWKIGEIIVRYEQNDQIRARYGEKTLFFQKN